MNIEGVPLICDEDVTFEARAILYYFQEEWKERGTGILKLLRERTKGKIRLLMRRENILKVIANHYISSFCELVHIKDTDLIWIACNCINDEAVIIKLGARFESSNGNST